MRRVVIPLVGVAAMLFAGGVTAQKTLGELLDAGAKRLTVEEFRAEVVQRLVVGPSPSGGDLEILYAAGGVVQGRGAPGIIALVQPATITGSWKEGDNGRICTSLVLGVGGGGGVSTVVLPPRCQFWFRHEHQYYLSDTDWDRSGRVLARTLKP